MMRKKHTLQNELLKGKGTLDKQNAKVTVQYIQNPQVFQNQNINNGRNIVHTAQEDLEIENVEYLEENTNVDEYIEERCEKDEFEDNFYPNAIYCLLDLYRAKYETLIMKNDAVKVAKLWRDIAKDMQESFFEFTERQIQSKYASLRDQYFGVRTKDDIENFDYFEQLHDIYKDVSKENIAKGFIDGKVNPAFHNDERFLQPEHLEGDERNLHEFKREEIVHKEHEFIDMVEKELQAMEDGLPTEVSKDITVNEINQEKSSESTGFNIKIIDPSIGQEQRSAKRLRLDSAFSEEPTKSKPNLKEYLTNNEMRNERCRSCNKTNSNFSFNDYNIEQERRHREKMALLEKSLQIQDRALYQQQQLLQELIKRTQP